MARATVAPARRALVAQASVAATATEEADAKKIREEVSTHVFVFLCTPSAELRHGMPHELRLFTAACRDTQLNDRVINVHTVLLRHPEDGRAAHAAR